jgi:hypothetical protein
MGQNPIILNTTKAMANTPNIFARAPEIRPFRYKTGIVKANNTLIDRSSIPIFFVILHLHSDLTVHVLS